MGRELVVAWVGRARRDDPWESLCADYRQRLERWMSARDLPVRGPAGGEETARRSAEGGALLAALPSPCHTVALDRRGPARSSRRLAADLTARLESWPHAIAFLIGSDLGLAPEVVAAADERWSLGPLTLPHALARLVVWEQLYRALSLREGIKYHREPF